MKIETVNIETIKTNAENPRKIKDENFRKLVKSIKDFPQMLEVRPIVVDDDNVVLGGNMRLKACKEAGLKQVPIIKASELTEEQKKEFVLKDNQSYGEWDTKLLSTWDKELLLDSGFEQWDLIDIFGVNEMTNGYKMSIEGSNFNTEEVRCLWSCTSELHARVVHHQFLLVPASVSTYASSMLSFLTSTDDAIRAQLLLPSHPPRCTWCVVYIHL